MFNAHENVDVVFLLLFKNRFINIKSKILNVGIGRNQALRCDCTIKLIGLTNVKCLTKCKALNINIEIAAFYKQLGSSTL